MTILPSNRQERKKFWQYIFIFSVVVLVAILLLQSYLAFHKQVYTACVLTAEQGTIPAPMRATCIQVGALDEVR